MSGGKGSQAENTNIAVQQEQADILKTQTQQSAEDKKRMNELQAPEISFLKDLVGGDKTKEMSAAAPTIAEITSGYDASKATIFNDLPSGPARDLALAKLDIGKDTGIASTLANITGGAREKLANIGSGLGAFSLNELGAALRGGEGAAATGSDVMNSEAQKKASTMDFLGQLVAGGASILTAGMKPSDRRLKRDIVEISDVLKKLAYIPVVKFRMWHQDASEQIGVIAQDVIHQFPELVLGTDDSKYSVDYGSLAAIAIKAVQEMAVKIQALEDQLAKLENHISMNVGA